MPHFILGSNNFIPVGNQCFIMLMDVFERPVAESDDVSMTEMRVGRYKCFHNTGPGAGALEQAPGSEQISWVGDTQRVGIR